MNRRMIDANIKPLFQKLEETGIPLDEERLLSVTQRLQKRLVDQKQAINREVGFTLNLHSDDHWVRALDGEEVSNFLLDRLLEAKKISFLIRKFQQIYDLASGNCRVRGRRFGLYPKYWLDSDGNIITTSELSMSDFPEEALEVVSYPGMKVIKATYLDIVLSGIQKLSGDPWLMEATAMDLVKLGFTNLFEDYRIGKLGAQIFAVALNSVYLLAPDEHIELLLSVCQECLGYVHTDFVLGVNVTTGNSLDKLA